MEVRGRQQGHLAGDPAVRLISQRGQCRCSVLTQVSSLRLGMKCKTPNRHDTAEIMTAKQNTSRDCNQRQHHTDLWLLSWSAIQFRKLKFSVIQEHVQNHVYSGHLVVSWMSEPQLLHFNFQRHSLPQWTKQMCYARLKHHKTGCSGQ